MAKHVPEDVERPSDFLRAITPPEYRETIDWYHESTRSYQQGAFLFGVCMGIAAEAPLMTFWEVLAQARDKVMAEEARAIAELKRAAE